MNLVEISRYEKTIAAASSDVVKKWIDELKLRASGLNSRYRGDLSALRFARQEQRPDVGLMGMDKALALSVDVPEAYQFQSEYNSIGGELSALGYIDRIKTAESVEPSAISNLMTMIFQKRKDLEDRTMQLLGSVNTVLKSIIAITYELKELDRNLSFYNLMKSSDATKKELAEKALKRIWVDNVDARKGGASLAALSRGYTQGQGGAGFLDLVGTFYSVTSLKAANELQKNTLYKDIIRNRYLEYEEWKKINETDLRNRREMLLQYLRSQSASFNMYKDWAAQSLLILKRINLYGINNAKQYMEATKRPDIFETAEFSVAIMAYKPIYLRDYELEYQKVFGKKGPELPVKIKSKSIAGPLETIGPKESRRSYVHQRLRKYGPKVISAIEASFAFTEKQTFPKGVPQERPQYAGSLSIKLKPYCFTLPEWYLFKKATEAYINKTVFEGIDAVSGSSLGAIQKELDAYIKEAEAKEKALQHEKKESHSALLDIFQSFRDDFFGINKALSSYSSTSKIAAFDPERYEIEVSHRMYGPLRMKDAIAVGLLDSNSDAYLIHDEFKRRRHLLSPLGKFDNPFF